uniref:Replicase n=1 Tax=Barley aphid RNA virus 2 TaxID=2703491 RepID=A0A6F8QH60_9VIRU|nr:replicase [Barley aphid RNA virus 2]
MDPIGNDNVNVNGKTKVDNDINGKIDNDTLNYMCSRVGADVDDLLTQVFRASVTDPTSYHGIAIRNMCMDKIEKDAKKHARVALANVGISQAMSQDDQDLLKSLYPEYTIYFTNKSRETHGFAHASRILETSLVMQRLHYYAATKTAPHNVYLKDVGGSRLYHGLKGNTAVHVCAPILGQEDEIRRLKADLKLSSISNSGYRNDKVENSVKLMRAIGSHYCNNMAQKCNVRASGLMFIHSIYDMTMTDVADAMSIAGAKFGAGTVIFDPLIPMLKTGILSKLNVMWEKYDIKNVSYIKFSFLNDSQPAYIHSYKNYLNIFRTLYFTDSKKKYHYGFRLEDNRAGIQYFSIYRLSYNRIPRSNLTVDYYTFVKNDYYRISYYSILEDFSTLTKIKKIHMYVPTILWDQVYDSLYQQNDGAFTMSRAHELVMSYNRKTIICGQTVSHNVKLPSHMIDKVASAAYIRVYIDKYLSSKTLMYVLSDVDRVRKLTNVGYFSYLWHVIKEKFSELFVNHDMKSQEIITPYLAWDELSKLYRLPVEVNQAVTKITVSHMLPEIIQAQLDSNIYSDVDFVTEEITKLQPISKTPSCDSLSTTTDSDYKSLSDDDFTCPINNLEYDKYDKIPGRIIAVPGDGDCLFHSVIVAMSYLGLPHPTTPHEMRMQLASDISEDRTKYFGDTDDLVAYTDFMTDLTSDGRPTDYTTLVALAIYYGFSAEIYFNTEIIDMRNRLLKYTNGDNDNIVQVKFTISAGSVGHFEPIVDELVIKDCNDEHLSILQETQRSIDKVNDSIADDPTLQERFHVTLKLADEYDSASSVKYIMNEFGICKFPVFIVTNTSTICGAFDDLTGNITLISKSEIEWKHKNASKSVLSSDDIDRFVECISDSHRLLVLNLTPTTMCDDDDETVVVLKKVFNVMTLNSDMIIRTGIVSDLNMMKHLSYISTLFDEKYYTYGMSEGTTTPIRYLVCVNMKKKYDVYAHERYVDSDLSRTDCAFIYEELCRFNMHVDALRMLYDNKAISYVSDSDYESYSAAINSIKKGGGQFVAADMMRHMLNVQRLIDSNLEKDQQRLFDAILKEYMEHIDNTIHNVVDMYVRLRSGANKFVDVMKKMYPTRIADVYAVTTSVLDIKCACFRKSFVPNVNGLYIPSCDCDVILYQLADGYMTQFKKNKYFVKSTVVTKKVHRAYPTKVEAKHKYIDHTSLQSFKIRYLDNIYKNFYLSKSIETEIVESIKRTVIDTRCDNNTNVNEKSLDTDETSSQSDNNMTLAYALHEALKKTVVPEPKMEKHEIFSTNNQINALKNSFVEMVNIWKYTHAHHESELKLVLNVAKGTSDINNLSNWVETRSDNVHVKLKNVWIPSKPTIDYMYVYNEYGFQRSDANKSDLYVVADYTEKKFEPVFLYKTQHIFDNLHKMSMNVKFEFISGVPGCGKTHYIMTHHSDTDLVLSATKAGALEFQDRAGKLKKPNIKQRYKTVYSYLYNDSTEFKTVYIDEAMMLHPGMIFSIAVLSKCKTIHMIGDHMQIPYYTRVDYPSRYHRFTDVFKITKELTTSYRCPQDVADYMKKYYKNFSSKSKTVKSLTRLYVSGKAEIPTGYDVYLTFTQSDKQMIQTDMNNVYTIHEYQGKQAKAVCLFRGSPTPIKVYDSKEHHIVALTRHTVKFVYASVVMDQLYDSLGDYKGAGFDSGVEYVTDNIMRMIKTMPLLYFDTGMKFGVHRDIATFVDSLQHEATYNDKINKNFKIKKYVGKQNVYVVVYKQKMTAQLLKKTFDLLVDIIDSNTKRMNSFITVDTFSEIIDWRYFVEIVEKKNFSIKVSDEKRRLDKYRLADVVKRYHDITYGDDDFYDDKYEELIMKRKNVMPECCVLVYTDMNVKFSNMTKYGVTFLDNNTITCVLDDNIYSNVAILTKHKHKTVARTIEGKNIKNFRSINALMQYYMNNDPSNDIYNLQDFINVMLPDAYDIRTDMDVMMVANSDMSVYLQNATFDASSMHKPMRFFDGVKPVLNTAMSPPRPSNSLKELVKAIEKRNCAVPKIQVTMNVWAKATELFKKMIRIVYDETVHDDIVLTNDSLQQWLDTQNSNISNLIKYTHYNNLEVNKYSLTIKKNSKPALDMSCVNTYASLQTVVFTPKDFNTLFCPMFKIMKKRMIETMNEKFLMYTDMPPDKFSEILTKRFSNYILQSYHSLEFDVSKYDKSQNLLHLIVDCMIMKHFGIPECFVSMWFFGHCNTKLYDPCNRFYCDVFFQRKSGDPSTWLLNTQQILTMIVNCIPDHCWEQIFLVIASGDDSEIFSYDKLQIQHNRFSDVFNYEVKIYDRYTSFYFCSKFLIITEERVYMLPDIYKLIKKLGRHDMKNREHVLSFRNSVLDSIKDFKVGTDVMLNYERSIIDRYKFNGTISIDLVYQSLCNIVYDASNFERLFIPNDDYYRTGYGQISDL